MIVLIYPLCSGVHGIARYVQSYVENYPADGPQLVVLTGEGGEPEHVPANVRFEHYPVSEDRPMLVKWNLWARARLKALARHNRIEALNLHLPPQIPLLFLPRVAPMVVTAHTTYLGMSGEFYDPPHFSSPWSRPSVIVKKWMEHLIFHRAAAIIALTEQGRAEVRRYGYRGPITILPNGVDLARFARVERPKKDIDVIFVGRIEIRKGSRPMVEAIKRLVARNPAIRICVVGYGDDFDYVKAELAGLGDNVRLTGKVAFSEVSDLLNASRIYASTSYYEGLPGTCLEAMAMGLPAVVWDYQFYDGLVVEGETGFRAAPNDIEGFARQVEKLLGAPDLEAFGSRAHKRVEEHFNWRKLGSAITNALLGSARDAK